MITGIISGRVPEGNRRPGLRPVTLIALNVRTKMIARLARRGYSIMTVRAGAGYRVMVHISGRPRDCRVARRAIRRALNMSRCFTGSD